MPYSRLFIWVEGRDDLRFFENQIKPLLQSKYDAVLVREYRQQSNTRIRNLISPRNEWGDHLVVGDIDDQPCVAAKKEQIVRRTFSRMQPENIFIVKPEIEAWYLAGLDAKSCRELGVAEIHNTDRYTKELFNLLVEASHFDSRVDLMQEMLRLFSVEVAKTKNSSFKYFASKRLAQEPGI